MCHKIVAVAVLFSAWVSFAAYDAPEVSGWAGIGYHSSWFTYETEQADDGVKLAKLSQFALSSILPFIRQYSAATP